MLIIKLHTMKKTRIKPKAKAQKKAKRPAPKAPGKDLILVHNPANISQEFFVASELADDSLIEQELLGNAMQHYVYGFIQDGKPVTGLSVAGVNETARQLSRNPGSGAKIRIIPDSLKITRDVVYDGDKGVEVQVVAENMVTGETGIGIKFEAYQKQGKRGKYKNTFAIEKAVSKAERNAKRKLIPEKAVVEMIKRFVSQHKYAEISSQPAPPVRQISAPIEGDPVYEPIQDASPVDYLGQLKTVLHKAGAKTEYEAVRKFNDFTGESLKHLKVDQKTAKQLLWNLLNSPMGSRYKPKKI